MASARLLAFVEELEKPLEGQLARAEELILRVPGEGRPALRADEEAHVLLGVAEGLGPIVKAWVKAVQRLADAERGWGTTDSARAAARDFLEATEEFLVLWEQLLLIQPATEPMRKVLGLVHSGCYELVLSGPDALLEDARAVAQGKAKAQLTFEPEAPSLVVATRELRAVRGAGAN